MERKTIREAYASMHEPESVLRLGNFYWMIVICAGIILMFASVCYGMWQFFMPPKAAESTVTVGGASSGFDKEQLQEAVQTLQKRQDDFEALRARP